MSNKLLTATEVRELFEQEFSEYCRGQYAQGKRVTATDRRCLFVEFVDFLERDGMISETMANNITL